jgi:hypothetical protein
MLDGFSREEFDERIAAERIDGTPPEWLERIAAILKLGFASMAWSKVEPDMFDPLRPVRRAAPFSGSPYQDGASVAASEPRAASVASPNQAAAMFASVFGTPRE